MKSIWSGLFVVFVLTSFIVSTSSEAGTEGTDHVDHVSDPHTLPNGADEDKNSAERTQQRSKSNKPLRNIVMGIYKNYKSTYLGNKTLTEYKQTLRESMKNKQQLQQLQQQTQTETESEVEDSSQSETKEDEQESIVTDPPEEVNSSSKNEVSDGTETSHNDKQPRLQLVKDSHLPKDPPNTQEDKYYIGSALNMSLDLQNSIVKVNLDGDSLKELVTGRWLSDNSEEGRGKKYEMVTRILPLFILPFLIQSAIVPFLVTKLKLLLMKSMLVGKLAIFLLIISAFRNSSKQMQTYEVAPSYWASEPSRRSEMAAAASSMAYNGYRVEGKPAAWIN